MKSIPEQVALRLRRAAALNQELQGRMFACGRRGRAAQEVGG